MIVERPTMRECIGAVTAATPVGAAKTVEHEIIVENMIKRIAVTSIIRERDVNKPTRIKIRITITSIDNIISE